MSIATEISRLQTAKTNLKSAIEGKGVTVGDVKLDEYYTKVNAIPVSPTPTTIKSKCYTKTLSTDQTSGTLEMTSADSDIAQHRNDTSFFIGLIALFSPTGDKQMRMMSVSNYEQSPSTASTTYYGTTLAISNSTAMGSGNIAYAANSGFSPIYADSTGKIIVKPTTSRVFKAGQYLIVCGWE
jgi:hypothetical protein